MVTKKILISLTLLLVSTLGFGQYLTKEKAQEDLMEFKTLLKNQSSYYQVSNFDFEKSLNLESYLKSTIEKSTENQKQ